MYEVEGHLSGREGLGWGAHEGVYEVVGLLSGREGSSQGRELGAGTPLLGGSFMHRQGRESLFLTCGPSRYVVGSQSITWGSVFYLDLLLFQCYFVQEV